MQNKFAMIDAETELRYKLWKARTSGTSWGRTKKSF